MKSIVWFRNDLRIKDNTVLQKALNSSDKVILLYCLDKRFFQKTSLGFDKTGYFRTKFLLESIIDLKKSIEKLGGNFLFRIGEPEIIIPQLINEFNISNIYYQKEITSEEVEIENKVKNKIDKLGCKINPIWGSTLYHLEDLSFEINEIPNIFTEYRKIIEKKSFVRSKSKKLDKLVKTIYKESDNIPTLEDLNFSPIKKDIRSTLDFIGGETEALKRLKKYVWEKELIKTYKETRNGLIGEDYSSKFSPWLSIGCISPITIFHEIKKYEKERVKNDSTYWLIFELIWRDYFKFISLKYKNNIFHEYGIKGKKISFENDMGKFNLWKEGKTGIPFIDANMIELKNTGFMSNRGRQNVASFLVKDLKLNWQLGAEYFESVLIDYDVCSNWCNWNYIAGIGNDPRENRYFNIIKQANTYDPNGNYVKLWIPQLSNLPKNNIHEPYKMSKEESQRLSFNLESDYCKPIIEL